MCPPGFLKAPNPRCWLFPFLNGPSPSSRTIVPWGFSSLLGKSSQCNSSCIMRQSHSHENKLHVTRKVLTRQMTQTRAWPTPASSCLPRTHRARQAGLALGCQGQKGGRAQCSPNQWCSEWRSKAGFSGTGRLSHRKGGKPEGTCG